MAGRTNFPALKQSGADSDEQLALVVNDLRLGKMNNTLGFTLTANVASTTITDPRIYETSVFLFDPRTAHAATELYGATMRVTSVSKGSVTIGHANNAQSDRTFAASIFS